MNSPRVIQYDIEQQYADLARQIENYGRGESALAKTINNSNRVLNRQALILDTDRDPLDVALRRTNAQLQYLKQRQGPQKFASLEKRLESLMSSSAACEPAAGLAKSAAGNSILRKNLFAEAMALNRALATSDARLDSIKQILFVVHGVLGGQVGTKSEYDGEHFCDQYFGHNGRPGGLYLLNDPFSTSPSLVNVFDSSLVENGPLAGQKITGGSFLSPELSWDARTVYFSWSSGGTQKWAEANRYHIFCVNIDGTGLRQLTSGNFDDIHPCVLPGGRIAFMSTRRGGFGRSFMRPVPAFTLHSMNADGTDLICLSYHEANEFFPSVDNDGRIIYTRWDHIDRANSMAAHLWLTYPDGRDPRSYHGNYPLPLSTFGVGPWTDGRVDRPAMETYIRSIPGLQGRYVAAAVPMHGESFGSLVLINTSVRDDGAMAQVTRLTPAVKFPETEAPANGDTAGSYGTPWPIDTSLYLCNFGRGIYSLDMFGNRTLLYQCDSIPYGVGMVRALSPIPVAPRQAPPAIATQTWQGERASAAAPMATIKLMNVMNSDFTWSFDGSIKWLRIIQLIPKTTPDKNDPTTGYASESMCRMPLGIVPVELDGSAYFEAPVGKCILFQALDDNGLAAMSMRTATYVHPGEQLMCIGCHDDKWSTPPVNFPTAWRRQPSTIAPEVPNGAMPFNFYTLAQPVLDAKCAPCHAQQGKGPDMSYASLADYVYALPGDSDAMTLPNTGGSRATVAYVGARASGLLHHLDSTHHAVTLTNEEYRRITLWLDCNANEFGVYQPAAQDSQRLGRTVWPDIDVDSANPTGVEIKAGIKNDKKVIATPATVIPSIALKDGLLWFHGLSRDQYTINVFDMGGRRILHRIIAGPGKAMVRFNCGTGIYIVKVKSGGVEGLRVVEKIR
ncbi:MAG TPA: hypothetical protein VLX68_06370 [Chitinivibrionales bacterium]|nr:hypothetical protein [Chitinivibrionales bacterium]